VSPVTYILWPNPPALSYGDNRILALMFACFFLVFLSVLARMWRKRTQNSVAKKLSRSWPGALLWFGIIGLVMAVSRVEQISYASMRLWWVVWALALLIYLLFQARVFRLKYYEKIHYEIQEDPLNKYLPKKKKQR